LIKRATLKFSGLAVQHVGFRDAVERVANELGVVGTIEKPRRWKC